MATSNAHVLSGTAKMYRPQSAHESHSYTRHPLVPSIATMNGSWGNSDATSEIRDHPAIKLLNDLSRLSSVEMELQKKSEIMNNLKLELVQLLQNQREKDLRYVEMEETLDTARMNKSLEDHLQIKVDKMAKDLKVSKKKSGELSSEVAQCNMRIRGLQEELRSEKEKNRLSNEHVAMLKENLESKQSSVVELKRMLDTERLAVKEMKQRITSLQKNLEDQRQSATVAQQDSTRRRDHLVAQAEKKLQNQIKDLEEKLILSKASESAMTTRLRSVEKELRDVNSEAVSTARPWMTHHPLPSQYSAVACVQELSSKCDQLKKSEEFFNVQLATTEKKLQHCTHSLEEVTNIISSAIQESNGSCNHLMKTLGELIGNLEVQGTSPVRHSPVCSSGNSSSTDSSGDEEGDMELKPAELDSGALLKQSLTQLLTMAKDHLCVISSSHDQLCQDLTDGCGGLGIVGSTAGDMLKTVFARLKDAEANVKEINDQLSAVKHDHEVSWKGALTALRADTDDRTKVAVETARQEERELVKNEMSHAMEELTRQHTERLEEKTREKEELTATIDEFKKTLSSKQKEIEQLVLEKSELTDNMAVIEETMSKNKRDLATMTEGYEEKLSKSEEELAAVQVVSHQHALTIVAMEKKLVSAVTKIAELEKALSEHQTSRIEVDSPTESECPSKMSGDVADRSHGDLEGGEVLKRLQEEHLREKEGLERELDEQKEEYWSTVQKCEVLQKRNKELEEEFSTVKKECQESQDHLRIEHKEKLDDLNFKLSNQEEDLIRKQQEIDSLQAEVASKVKNIKELSLTVQELKSAQITVGNETGFSDNVLPKTHKSTLLNAKRPRTAHSVHTTGEESTSSELGAVCVSERHSQVISQQKQTIKDLRQKLKDLKESKPPTPSQLVLIHKAQELSYKVNTLQSEANLYNRVDAGTLPGGMEAQTQTLANMEDISAANCQDLQNALEASEHMLIHLLVGLCQSLSYEPSPPKDSVVHIPSSERADLIRERRKFVKVMNSQVEKALKMLHSKERLLEVARKEVKELQHSQQETLEATVSTASLAEEQGKKARQLSEELANVQDELDQQKRLNETLLKRKRLSEDQQKRMSVHKNSHSCMTTPEEVKHKLEKQKISHSEQMKKKAIQITGLRKELKLTSQKLDATSMRLKAVEGKRV